MKNVPKYRRPLNPNQLTTLLFIFKFRYISSHLLSSSFGNKTRRSMHQTLNTLEEQGYIAKRYKTSYKLQGRPASYYLLPKAVHEIQARYSFSNSVLRTYMRNSSVSDGFIDHHIDIVKAYIRLRSDYPNMLHIFTKYEIADFDHFPNPKSDIYIRRIRTSSGKPKEYLLDIYDKTPLFAIRRRVDYLINFFETNHWEGSYPAILLVCSDSKTEAKLQSFSLKCLDSSELVGLPIYTSTAKALLSKDSDKAIWSNAENPDHIFAL